MAFTLTKLRTHLFQVVDHLIATGDPVEIRRKGYTVKIVLAKKKDKFDNLKRHSTYVKGNSDDLVHMDWSCYWDEERNL